MRTIRFGRCFAIAIAIFTIIMCSVMAHPALAEDQILTAKIQQIEQKLDKNGNQYCRIFIEEQKELSGIQYRTSTAVMGFGASLVEQMKSLKKGDTIKAVVATNEYKGRTSYNVLALIQ
jgi:hypothetical protein